MSEKKNLNQNLDDVAAYLAKHKPHADVVRDIQRLVKKVGAQTFEEMSPENQQDQLSILRNAFWDSYNPDVQRWAVGIYKEDQHEELLCFAKALVALDGIFKQLGIRPY